MAGCEWTVVDFYFSVRDQLKLRSGNWKQSETEQELKTSAICIAIQWYLHAFSREKINKNCVLLEKKQLEENQILKQMDVELYKANHKVDQIWKVAAFMGFSQWLSNSCHMYPPCDAGCLSKLSCVTCYEISGFV